MSEAPEHTPKPKLSVRKIIAMVVVMVSCYAVAFSAAQWVLAPDASDLAAGDTPQDKTLSAKQAPEAAQ